MSISGTRPVLVLAWGNPSRGDDALGPALLEMLGLAPRELMRTREQEYREAGLDDPTLSRAQLIDAMVKYPKLIERPIVVRDGKTVIGRPPEKVLEILGQP